MNSFSAFFISIFRWALQAIESMGEIGHQHMQAPLAAAISSLAISPST